MRLFRRDRRSDAAVAVAEPDGEHAGGFAGDDAQLDAEIARLTAANRARRDIATERRLLLLRNLAGLRRMAAAPGGPEYVVPDFGALPPEGSLPEIAGTGLTAGVIRAGILRDGCLLVRGLVDAGRAAALAEGIDRAYAGRRTLEAGGSLDDGLYEEFEPSLLSPGRFIGRDWIKDAGGLLAADSPRMTFEWNEMLAERGIPELVRGYLGEEVLTSVHKTTLRKVEPTTPGAWHQDGNFMGEVRALNLWVALSRCGDVAPGMDLVPRRLDHIVTSGDDGTFIQIQVSDENAREAAGDREIVRPIFEPGDAIFFDEMFLHQTASDPETMTEPRFAVENWFFGASAFPEEYAPLAV